MRAKHLLTSSLVCTLLSLLSASVCRAQTDGVVKQARHRAAAFLNVADNHLSRANLASLRTLQSVCVFNDSAKGSFVITSTNEDMPEVLGYSHDRLFDVNDIPPQLKELLEEYEMISQHSTSSTKAYKVALRKAASQISMEKNLNTALYNQQTPYNNYCPSGCYTGCTATAMSIAMRYYGWPLYGRGTHSYEWNGQTLSHNFNTVFDWNNMLTSYTQGNYTTEQGNAVAKLCYACGVSVDMNYSTTGSTGSLSDAARSLTKYFKYSPEVRLLHQERLGYSADEWMALIRNEINAGRPIIYSGNNAAKTNGHAFIIQGYRDNYVNVNWGWDGNYNDYFLLSSMIPYNSDAYDYSYDHYMIVNIVPDYNESEFSPLQTARVASTYNMICSVESVEKNVRFTVTTGNLQNRDDEAFEGYIGIALINKKSEIRDIVSSSTFKLQSGYYYSYYTLFCISEVNSEDGDSLALVWRYADNEDWKRVPGDGSIQSAIAVKGVSDTEDGIGGIDGEDNVVPQYADVFVYQMNGTLVARIPRQRVMRDYAAVLSSLGHGIYMIKVGNETRKVIK